MFSGRYGAGYADTHTLTHTCNGRCQNSVKHYRVEWNGKQFCFGLGKFTTLDALIEHFDNQPMISGESGISHTPLTPSQLTPITPHRSPTPTIQSLPTRNLRAGSL